MFYSYEISKALTDRAGKIDLPEGSRLVGWSWKNAESGLPLGVGSLEDCYPFALGVLKIYFEANLTEKEFSSLVKDHPICFEGEGEREWLEQVVGRENFPTAWITSQGEENFGKKTYKALKICLRPMK